MLPRKMTVINVAVRSCSLELERICSQGGMSQGRPML
jgi:hypothetical protein